MLLQLRRGSYLVTGESGRGLLGGLLDLAGVCLQRRGIEQNVRDLYVLHVLLHSGLFGGIEVGCGRFLDDAAVLLGGYLETVQQVDALIFLDLARLRVFAEDRVLRMVGGLILPEAAFPLFA